MILALLDINQNLFIFNVWLCFKTSRATPCMPIYHVLCLLLFCSLLMCADNRLHYGPMVVIFRLHIALHDYNHYANLSEGITLLNCLQGAFCLECVSVRWIIFHVISGAVCIQLTHLSDDDCENNCTLYYYHYHQVSGMTYLSLLSIISWYNCMHCMSFYILM